MIVMRFSSLCTEDRFVELLGHFGHGLLCNAELRREVALSAIQVDDAGAAHGLEGLASSFALYIREAGPRPVNAPIFLLDKPAKVLFLDVPIRRRRLHSSPIRDGLGNHLLGNEPDLPATFPAHPFARTLLRHVARAVCCGMLLRARGDELTAPLSSCWR